MNTMDIVLIGVLAASLAYDAFRGALKSLATVLALVAAVYGGGILARAFPLLGGKNPAVLAMALNYLVYGVGLFLGVYLVSRLAFVAARLAGLKKYDHAAGAALGLVRGLAIGSALSYLVVPRMSQPGRVAPVLAALAGQAAERVAHP